MPRVHQINLSNGGVPKLPVPKAKVMRTGMEGDAQADQEHHGGPDQTLCLYSLEVIEALRAEGHPIAAGSTGENLTIEGLDWAGIQTGQRFRVGQDLTIEVTFPATPCAKNARWFDDGRFRRMSHNAHPGSSRWYAKVLSDGVVTVGDVVELLEPAH